MYKIYEYGAHVLGDLSLTSCQITGCDVSISYMWWC